MVCTRLDLFAGEPDFGEAPAPVAVRGPAAAIALRLVPRAEFSFSYAAAIRHEAEMRRLFSEPTLPADLLSRTR